MSELLKMLDEAGCTPGEVRAYLAVHPAPYWTAGCRVYCVANERLTGTVLSTTDDGRFVYVHWDDQAGHTDLCAHYTPEEIEWYTRPAAMEGAEPCTATRKTLDAAARSRLSASAASAA
ncbi:MAG: hypothetical protein ABI806_24800 [Candidatus Solibacter sp.]